MPDLPNLSFTPALMTLQGELLSHTASHTAPSQERKHTAGTAKKIWYRLDLSAIVYPTLQRRDFSSVYRLSVVLKEPIRPDILQQAVDAEPCHGEQQDRDQGGKFGPD